MTKLRDQLDQARADYQSIAYPGELATEILPRRRPAGPRWFFPLIVSSAVAAAVSLVMVYRSTEPVHPNHLSHINPAPGQVSPTHEQVVYVMPSRVPLTLPVAPFMATTPPVSVSLTSFSENLGALQQGYEELGPRLMHNFNKGSRAPERTPAKGREPGAGPANEPGYLSPFLTVPVIGRA